MNDKFLVLKDILEKLLNSNSFRIPDNLSYVSTTWEKKIILYVGRMSKEKNIKSFCKISKEQ